jgi:hypothetical protein
MNVFFPLIIALLARVMSINLCFALLPMEPSRSTKRGSIRTLPARSESNPALLDQKSSIQLSTPGSRHEQRQTSKRDIPLNPESVF